MPPGDPHTPHPPILPFTAVLLTHLEGPRMLSCSVLHTAAQGSFQHVPLTMLPPRGKPSVAPYPWDRVQAHLRGIPGLLAIKDHLCLAPLHPEFLSLPLSHSLWPLGNSTPSDTSPLIWQIPALSSAFAQIRPPPGSPPGPTGLFRHHPP